MDRELKQAAQENTASEPRRYFSLLSKHTGIDMDAEAWEYGVMDGNLAELRIRQEQARQARYFERSQSSSIPRDVKVFHMRNAKGH